MRMDDHDINGGVALTQNGRFYPEGSWQRQQWYAPVSSYQLASSVTNQGAFISRERTTSIE
jgi:hypothetical protein